MSHRLDKEREARLQPARMQSCLYELKLLGYSVESDGYSKLEFNHNGKLIRFWPYSGWYSGSGIGSGRGFNNLLGVLNAKS